MKLAVEEEQTSKQIINTEYLNWADCTKTPLTENIIVSLAVIHSMLLHLLKAY